MAGAEISVDVGDQRVWTLSGKDGCFALDLPPGDHSLRVEKVRYGAARDLDVRRHGVYDLGLVPLDGHGVRIAVVHGEYDDAGALLGDLGIHFRGIAQAAALYSSRERLDAYEVVFANCGSDLSTRGVDLPPHWLDNVRGWIEDGGTLYASDWEHGLYAGVVPDAVTFADPPKAGPTAQIDARVLDRDVMLLLGGSTASIRYVIPDWTVIASAGEGTALVEARIPGLDGVRPLAVKHQLGRGRAIFTTFHNEEQITSDMQAILYEVILTL